MQNTVHQRVNRKTSFSWKLKGSTVIVNNEEIKVSIYPQDVANSW